MEPSSSGLQWAQGVQAKNSLSIRVPANRQGNNGPAAPRAKHGFEELPEEGLPGANIRGKSSLVNVFNTSGKRQVSTLRKGVSGKNANAAKNLSSGAKSYVDQGSLDEIFNSMGIFKKRPAQFLNASQEAEYKQDLDKTFISPAFQEGAIKLALIRLVISGRIQYRESKIGILGKIIGDNYKFSNSDVLKESEKEDFDKVLELIAKDDVDSFDFHYRGGIRKLAIDMFASLIFSSIFVGIPLYFSYPNPMVDTYQGKLRHLREMIKYAPNYREEGFPGSVEEYEAAIEAAKLVEAANLFAAIPSGIIVTLIIKLILVYCKSSNDKQLIINVLIKLLDTFLRSDELVFRALASESISNVPLLYNDAESLAIYYKYVNELKRLGVKEIEDNEKKQFEKHPQLSNFMSGDDCAICQSKLAMPLMDTFEICENHHKFHKLCTKAYYDSNHNFKCPICREAPLAKVLEELMNYSPIDLASAGGSRKKQKTRKNRKKSIKHRHRK